jgi:hypothetical protein
MHSILFPVFSNSPCREAPKNALKKKGKKEEGACVLFLRAGADVRRFPVLFFLPPLDAGAGGSCTRGAAKFFRQTPPAHGLNPSPTHPTSDFFPLDFLVRFWAFLGKASSKTPHKYFCKKSMSKTFPQNNRQKFRCQFFLDFFLFYRVFGCFSAIKVPFKATTKTFYKKVSCQQVFTKNSTKNPKPIFLDFVSLRFWAFLGEGSSKT